MTYGICLRVGCMCGVMKEGMCEKYPIRFVMHLMVWSGGIENVMENVLL